MFTLNFRRLYYVCDKVLIRGLRSKRLVGPNPGLDRRVEAFREDGLKIEDDDAEEFVELSESTFYNVGEAYTEHMNETLMGKHDLRHHIIKDKYFKENTPNLLTWSEKEQIRHLVNTYPDEWTLEKIAESFPVTVPVVKKLLKFPWKPAKEERIARHDASAMRNWKELKEGRLNIPENLREHFLKFSERSIPPLNRKSIKDELTQEEKIGEFQRIIQRCAAKENINHSESVDNATSSVSTDTYATQKKGMNKKDAKVVTLDELTSRIKNRLKSGNDVTMPDKIILDTVSDLPETPKDYFNEIEIYNDNSDKEGSKELTEYKENENKMFSDGSYPQRIRIPKKAFKKGATYKVSDCFYDDDGRFLYRVIGMTKN